MDILFASEKLRKQLSSNKEIVRRYGPIRAKPIMRRMVQLRAAPNLETLRALPQIHCHELGQNRQDQLAVDVDHHCRLIFENAHDPRPTKPDGGLNWRGVTSIRVIELVDYHGK